MWQDYDYQANLHVFSWKDDYFAVDVNSGAVHVLDRPAFLLLSALIENNGDYQQAREKLTRQWPAQVVAEIWQEMVDLHRQGALFTALDPVRVDTGSMALKALCLNAAHACNMNCSYCFAAQGDFGMKPGLMSLEVAKQAVDFLIAHSGGRRHLEIDFFGGEPLLAAGMLKDLVEYCRRLETLHGKEFTFTLTTNALLLDDEVIDWVIANNISVIMSLDGRPKVHDQYRPLKDGAGSYAAIIPRIKAMVAANPVSYYIRGTFTRQNLDFADDCRHILELGFSSLSLEPAVGPDNGYAIQAADLPRVKQEYERLAELLLEYYQSGHKVHFYHFNLDMQQGPCLAKRLTGCGAGVEYLTVTPEGNLYPCHQLVGEEGFLLGNVFQDELDSGIKQLFSTCQVHDKECIRCWARYYCGGGCLAQAYLQNGDIKKPHRVSCEMHRKRVEAAIFLDYYRRRGKIYSKKQENYTEV